MPARPQAYILNGNGGLNAFATRFLGMQYVVLMSGVVDAMDKHVDRVRFYIGHELGHLRTKHLCGQFFRWPVLWLPLLGAAYSRARESTCDRHGLACSTSPEGAARALAALAAGVERWQQLDVRAYLRQAQQAMGFWMSFHEIVAGYPWLSKRAARVMSTEARMPRRNDFAYLPALFVPYAGRAGACVGFLIMIYIMGVLAAIAIPAYQDYTKRAQVSIAVADSRSVLDALERYYLENKKIPASLEIAGIPSQLTDKIKLSLDPAGMVLTVSTEQGQIVFVPRASAKGGVEWKRANGEGLKPAHLPAFCRATGN